MEYLTKYEPRDCKCAYILLCGLPLGTHTLHTAASEGNVFLDVYLFILNYFLFLHRKHRAALITDKMVLYAQEYIVSMTTLETRTQRFVT